MVEFPFEFARTFPKLDGIGFIGSEEIPKVSEDSDGMNLERMRSRVEDLLGCMNGIRDNNDLGNIIQQACLVDATSDSK